MKVFFSSFKTALNYLKTDRVILCLSILPVVFGIIAYYYFGRFVFTEVFELKDQYIKNYFGDGSGSNVIFSLVVAIVTVVFFFFINFTFVLLVSIVASPFSDLISERVEKREGGKEPPPLGRTLVEKAKKIFFILANELKKISFIVILSLFSFLISFIGFLAPVSLIISAILIAIQFLDYNWSRHDYLVKQCFSDIRSNFFPYTIAGFVFLFLVSLPIVNLIALPFGVIYFTVLWNKLNVT